jgi:hypothetical protein
MKKIIPITLILFYYFINCGSASQEAPTPKNSKEAKIGSRNFSAYHGKNTWEDAKAKCDSIGMRLPTRAELDAAYKAKEIESWEADGIWYWTSEEVSENFAYSFTVGYGDVGYDSKGSARRVRCIR